MERQLEAYQKIERSIIKKFRKQLWTPFIVAVKRYELIQAGDKIAVCISGGKDSMVMAKLLQELQRHSEVPFELVYLVMDPGYTKSTAKRSRATPHCCIFPSRCLKQTSLMWQTTAINLPATFVPGCAVAICIKKRSSLAATKSRSAIISMMLSRQPS